MITRDRCARVLATLPKLLALPEQPDVLLIDNASSDGTSDKVRERYPSVRVVRLDHNAGAAGRTIGVRLAPSPYVAFSDDDSWWQPGALSAASRLLDASPRLAVVAARILVGPEQRLDPVCQQMSASPLPPMPGVGPRVLGFVACGSVVRRDAYLEVGGFHPRYELGSEEGLLALELAERGWWCAYADAVVAHHDPGNDREEAGRAARQARNDLWTLWLRRRPPAVVAGSARLASAAIRHPPTRSGVVQAFRRSGWVLRERSPVSREVDRLATAVRLAKSITR